ncbi:MAG: FIST N-terminal domain-containing protein [Dehalococcoidia bacterium]
MQIEQSSWADGAWQPSPPGRLEGAQLVLVFGAGNLLRREVLGQVATVYPDAVLFGCSTSGEICDTVVSDDSVVVTAVQFRNTKVAVTGARLADGDDGYQTGLDLAGSLDPSGLRHVFVLSDGVAVNGTRLVQGLTEALPDGITITGGLAGDGDRFEETLVLLDGQPEPGVVSLAALYGDSIRVGFGSMGGWDPFGPERVITRASNNVLYELDGHSALDLYKRYLGEHARDLPGSGLLFPLSIRTGEKGEGLVRTIIGVSEADQSLTFAGEMPEGSYARLMKANFDRLIDGATGAAQTSFAALSAAQPELALLISCVGRKLVLKQRIDEEVEGVRDVLGEGPVLTGFYSYGEISPFTPGARCELHNQTMTITTLREAA